MNRIGLVTRGDYVHAWVLDLPGCIVGGRNLDDAWKKLPLAIAEHIAWLRTHGEQIDQLSGWQLAETVDASTAAGGDPCFEVEREPLDEAALETLIRRLAFARNDLISTTEPLPDLILDWVPPSEAFEKFDPWAPDVRTIRGLVQHVLQFEVYYRDGLRDGAAKGIYERVADPPTEHAETVAQLRALVPQDRSRVYHPLRPGQTTHEDWTVRKVLRRLISHERAHAAEILQRRTWLLLGTPGQP